MKNVPKLRFKEFSGEWQTKKLDQYLVEYRDRVSAATDLPILTSSRNGLFFQKDYFNDRELKNDGEYGVVPRGYFTYRLMSDDATFKFNINNLVDKGAISKEYPVFTVKDINSYFLLQKLNHGNEFKEYAITNRVGGTRTRLYFKKLIDLYLILPMVEEQTKIAAFLTAIDNRISQLVERCSLLEQYKKAVMQKIFSQELRFKDEEGREFPAWEEKRLGDVTSKVSKKNKDNISYPIYSISNKNGFVPQSEQFDGVDSNDRNYDISLYKIVQKNTFAYNPARINVGSIGYSGELNNIIISSLYVCFKTSESVSDKYMLQYLDSFEFRKGVLRSVEGGVREYLFYENFSSIKHTFPSLKEQEKIAGFLTAVDDKIAVAKAKLEAVQQYKQGLLQQMFV